MKEEGERGGEERDGGGKEGMKKGYKENEGVGEGW